MRAVVLVAASLGIRHLASFQSIDLLAGLRQRYEKILVPLASHTLRALQPLNERVSIPSALWLMPIKGIRHDHKFPLMTLTNASAECHLHPESHPLGTLSERARLPYRSPSSVPH